MVAVASTSGGGGKSGEMLTIDCENTSSAGSALLAIFITSRITSFAVTIPTRLPCFASTTGSACNL